MAMKLQGHVLRTRSWNSYGLEVRAYQGKNLQGQAITSLNGAYSLELTPGPYTVYIFDKNTIQTTQEITIEHDHDLSLRIPYHQHIPILESLGFLLALIAFFLAYFFKARTNDRLLGWLFLGICIPFIVLTGVELLQILVAHFNHEYLAAMLFPLKHCGLPWFGFFIILFWQKLTEHKAYWPLGLIAGIESLIILSWILFGSDQAFEQFWHFTYAQCRAIIISQNILALGYSLWLIKHNSLDALQERLNAVFWGLITSGLLAGIFIVLPLAAWHGQEFFVAQYALMSALIALLIIGSTSYGLTNSKYSSLLHVTQYSFVYVFLSLCLALGYALVMSGLELILNHGPCTNQTKIYALTLLIALGFWSKDKIQVSFERLFYGDILAQKEKLALVGTLAAGLAHEIKNPLAAMKNTLSVAQQDKKLTNHAIAICQRQIKRINDLTTALLTFSKPSHLHKEPLSLYACIQNLLTLLEPIANKANIKIMLVGIKTKTLYTDKKALEQIVLNISLNALEAMPQGGTLRIQLKEQALMINDTGIGMDATMLKKVGEPFFTTKTTGTGLGVATAKKLVDQLGWRMHITSKPQKGTTFTLYW